MLLFSSSETEIFNSFFNFQDFLFLLIQSNFYLKKIRFTFNKRTKIKFF